MNGLTMVHSLPISKAYISRAIPLSNSSSFLHYSHNTYLLPPQESSSLSNTHTEDPFITINSILHQPNRSRINTLNTFLRQLDSYHSISGTTLSQYLSTMANPGHVKKQPAEPVCNPTTVGVGLGSYRPGIYDAPAHPFLVFPLDMPLPDSGHRPPVRGDPRPATSSDESSNKQPVDTKPANGWPSPERSRQLGFGEVRPGK